VVCVVFCFFVQAEDGIRDKLVTGVQTCALQIILDEYFNLPKEDRKREATVEELVRQERKERDKRRSGLDNDSSCKRQ